MMKKWQVAVSSIKDILVGKTNSWILYQQWDSYTCSAMKSSNCRKVSFLIGPLCQFLGEDQSLNMT
jgi:hypothetical protein